MHIDRVSEQWMFCPCRWHFPGIDSIAGMRALLLPSDQPFVAGMCAATEKVNISICGLSAIQQRPHVRRHTSAHKERCGNNEKRWN